MEENKNQEIISESIQNNQIHNNSNFNLFTLLYILFSIAILLLIFNIYDATITNYHDYFLHEGQGSPPSSCVNSFLSITLPFIIIYSIIFILILKKIALRFLIFPFTFFILFTYYWLYKLLDGGPVYGWSMFWMVPLLIFGIFITFILGILSTKNKKLNKINKASIITLFWSCLDLVFCALLTITNPVLIIILIRIIPVILLIVSICVENYNIKIVCNIVSLFFIVFTTYKIVSSILIIINIIYIIASKKETNIMFKNP